MTTPVSLQPWSWQIFILIQLWWQFFPNVCLWRRSLCSNLVLTLKTKCIEPPSYASTKRECLLASTAYVLVIWPSFLFESFAKIWATSEIFLGKWFTPPPPGKKISRTPMSHRTANVARTPSRKWELNSNWLTARKECGSILSSRLWGGALRDDTKNGCVAD